MGETITPGKINPPELKLFVVAYLFKYIYIIFTAKLSWKKNVTTWIIAIYGEWYTNIERFLGGFRAICFIDTCYTDIDFPEIFIQKYQIDFNYSVYKRFEN